MGAGEARSKDEKADATVPCCACRAYVRTVDQVSGPGVSTNHPGRQPSCGPHPSVVATHPRRSAASTPGWPGASQTPSCSHFGPSTNVCEGAAGNKGGSAAASGSNTPGRAACTAQAPGCSLLRVLGLASNSSIRPSHPRILSCCTHPTSPDLALRYRMQQASSQTAARDTAQGGASQMRTGEWAPVRPQASSGLTALAIFIQVASRCQCSPQLCDFALHHAGCGPDVQKEKCGVAAFRRRSAGLQECMATLLCHPDDESSDLPPKKSGV
jgi:hypothetical protein